MRDLQSPTGDFVSYVATAVGIDINTQDRRQQITEIIQQALKTLKVGETDPLLSPDLEPEPDVDWIDKKIKGFTFKGKPYKVKRWSDFLTEFCKILSENYPDRFEDVLQLKPRIFSKNPAADFPRSANPKPIGETGIYIQTRSDNNAKYKIVKDLVKYFGCDMPVPHLS